MGFFANLLNFLATLWLPILVTAVAVWFASCLAWMAVGHHKQDWKGIPNEDDFIATIKRMGIPPGNYGYPEFRRCEGLSQEEKKAKFEEMQKNPMGLLRVWGPIHMGRNMVLTFLVYLVASTLIGYIGWNALPHGGGVVGGVAADDVAIPGRVVSPPPDFGKVMQVLGTAGILAYCFAGLPNDIWFQKSKREVLTHLIDGVVFGLITGAVFGWLWPR